MILINTFVVSFKQIVLTFKNCKIMWIALLIVGIYAWISKRKKKAYKTKTNYLFVALVTLVSPIICQAQENKVTISGEITTSKQNVGTIIIFLVDETAFKTPLTGVDTVIVKPSKEIVSFKFKPRTKGVYGIRCYHDINENKKLDKKGWSPKEPYGFSWKNGKKFPLGFDDISFVSNADKFVKIKMEE